MQQLLTTVRAMAGRSQEPLARTCDRVEKGEATLVPNRADAPPRASTAGWVGIALAALATVPGLVLELGGLHPPDPVRALIFGVAIVGAAFLVSWAAEVVQLDFSQGLALALLALIAVLPEYVVDATYAWLAATDPTYASYAIANMT